MTEHEDLIQEIKIQRARTSVIVGAAALVVERSNRISEDILRELDESQPETEEAIRVLRRSGLL